MLVNLWFCDASDTKNVKTNVFTSVKDLSVFMDQSGFFSEFFIFNFFNYFQNSRKLRQRSVSIDI